MLNAMWTALWTTSAESDDVLVLSGTLDRRTAMRPGLVRAVAVTKLNRVLCLAR